MPNTVIYNDGNVPFGSFSMTFSGSTWIVESTTGTAPSKVVDVPNEVNGARAQVIIADKKTFSQTWQIPNFASTGSIPNRGDTITLPQGFDGSSKSGSIMIVTEVGTPREMGDYWKCNVSGVEKLN